MEFKDFLDELKDLKDERQIMRDNIKNSNLPVILFGNGPVAEYITKIVLEKNGISVDGYCVDEEYFQENTTFLHCPVYRLSEILNKPGQYILIPAIARADKNDLSFLNNEGIISYAPQLHPDVSKIDSEYITENKCKFEETFSFLEDDLSRKTGINHLKLKITGNYLFNRETYFAKEYFNDLTEKAFPDDEQQAGFVDGGAYYGDTIEQFVNWRGGKYNKIFSFELDPVNFKKAEKFVKEKGYKNVGLFNCGVWDENTQVSIKWSGTEGATVSDKGGLPAFTKKIDDVVGDSPIHLIKLDVEGAELRALMGAQATIQKNKPALAICAYHKSEDLITLPQYIKTLNKDYKIYLRQHSFVTEYDLVVYAIP